MSITVVVPPTTTLLTTLDRLKAELGITVTADDPVLSDMIERASSAIARECRRTFGRETVAETLDGTGTRLLGLSVTPIVSITSVTEDSVTLASTEYSIEDAESGALYRLNGWGRSSGLRMWGTEAFASGYIMPGYQDRRYTVTYVGGYLLPPGATPNLPGAIEQACLETVKTWFAQRDGVVSDATSVKIGSLSVQYSGAPSDAASQFGLPAVALGLLRNSYARALG